MFSRFLILVVAIALAPAGLTAQGIGLGVRAGTIGVGGEAAVALTERVVLRGGIGFSPLEPGVTFDDLTVDLRLPTWYNAGLDLYLNGAVRIGGGILFKSRDFEVEGVFGTPQDIGGTSFTPQELGTLTGVINSRDRVPYVLIGIGRHTASEVGLFLDVGVAFMGTPTVALSATDGTLAADTDPLLSALQQESANFELHMPRYLEIVPIISLGIRLGPR